MRGRIPGLCAAVVLCALAWASPCPGASTKENGGHFRIRPAEDAPRDTPAAPGTVTVLTDLDPDVMRKVLDFITESTGVPTRLLAYPHDGSVGEPGRGFDLFMGSCVQPRRFAVRSFSPESWEELPGRASGGVFRWAWWRSTLVLNEVLTGPGGTEDELVGAVTAVHPEKDRLTAAVLYTLYREYGPGVLERLHGMIPRYASSREQVVSWVESGRYPGAYTVDAYFNASVRRGHPLRFDHGALDTGEHPRTSVAGENIAFISAASASMEEAELVAGFLASPSFQEFVRAFFNTAPPSHGTLPLRVEEGWLPGLLEAWGRLPLSGVRDWE